MVKNNEERSGNNKKITRRSTLKILGGSALGSVASVGVVQGTSTVTIPEHVEGDEVVSTRKVPKPWYEHMRNAEEAVSKAHSRFGEKDGIFFIGLGVSKARFGGTRGFFIDIEETEEYSGGKPDRIDGIPVKFSKAPKNWGKGCTNFELSSVDGGICVTNETDGGWGSNCSRVHFNGNEYMLTARHIFNGTCNDASAIGEVAGQRSSPNSGATHRDIGTIEGEHVKQDWAYYDASLTSESITAEIDDNSSYPIVRGYVARETVKNMASNGETVHNMGTNTGLTSGAVKNIDAYFTYDCANFGYDGVRTHCDFGEGDSGGPTFDYANQGDSAYLVNITTHGYKSNYTGCDGGQVYHQSAGTSADHMAEWGLSFS